MSPWKVIVATAVIFGAGALTGSLMSRHTEAPKRTRPTGTANTDAVLPQPWFVRREFLAKLDQRLQLTPEQHQSIAQIIEEGQERTRALMLLIGPELQEELVVVRAKIRAQLSAEQQKQFDEMLQRGRSRQGRTHAGTNTSALRRH